MESGPVVRVEVANGVATITLDRPEVLNAMSPQLMDELRIALEAAARSDAVRCVVLRGSGRAFCSGGDVNDIAQRRAATGDVATSGAIVERLHRQMVRDAESILLLKSMPKPTVAVVQGWAVGGGMSLALAADFRVLACSAQLRPGFIPHSLSGDFGISGLLVSSLGSARAREILLLNRTLTADDASALGLANLVVDDDELDAAVADFIQPLATGPTIAIGRAKDNLNLAETTAMAELLVAESLNQRVAAATADAHESGTALAERRLPKFTGR